jgi:ABC-2 type transport system ATP-binding protein
VTAMIANSLAVAGNGRPAAPHDEPAIQVAGLRKSYDGVVQALDGVDLQVRRGELLALLGPNGAGKTTLVEILEGHREADGGHVRVLGFAPGRRQREFRARIGIVLQEEGLDPAITVHEAIELYSAAYPHPRPADEVAELVGLGDRRDARVQTLSGGQRRRLDLALGIAGDPELLFLDEPTTGFDPAARRQSWDLIARLRALGKTILLTTHYMDEAQQLADRVAVIANGRMIAEGTPDTLGRGAGEAAVVAFQLPDGVELAELPLPRGAELEPRERRLSLRTTTPTRDLAPLLAWAAERDTELEGLTVTRPSLEDVYLQLTEEPT